LYIWKCIWYSFIIALNGLKTSKRVSWSVFSPCTAWRNTASVEAAVVDLYGLAGYDVRAHNWEYIDLVIYEFMVGSHGFDCR